MIVHLQDRSSTAPSELQQTMIKIKPTKISQIFNINPSTWANHATSQKQSQTKTECDVGHCNNHNQ